MTVFIAAYFIRRSGRYLVTGHLPIVRVLSMLTYRRLLTLPHLSTLSTIFAVYFITLQSGKFDCSTSLIILMDIIFFILSIHFLRHTTISWQLAFCGIRAV